MSNRCLGVLALTMIVPLTARAQDVTTLERRLTQLDALRHNAQAAAVRAESTSRESFDTIGAGSLRVVARLADAELIHRAAGIAWPRLDTLYGTAAAPPRCSSFCRVIRSTIAAKPLRTCSTSARPRTPPRSTSRSNSCGQQARNWPHTRTPR